MTVMPDLAETLKTIHSLHGNSPVLRIFASSRFPLAAALTRICFINPETSEAGEDQLYATLEQLLQAAREIETGADHDSRLQDDPRHYLDQWSNVRGTHWFSVHADPAGLRLYRLTPAGREAHTILVSIEAGRSVATESRLKRFIDLANDLAARASGKADRRINELKSQIARAQREIAEIERTGHVASMPEREVIAGFEELLRIHGAIGADLDQVRELVAQHRTATHDIVMTSDQPKGRLLDIVFSEEDKVRETDEYASLDALRQLLTDDELRASTRRRVEELKGHPAIYQRFIATGKMPARFDGAVESFFDRSRRIDIEFTGYYEQLRGIVVREDIEEMRAVSRTHKSLSKRFVEIRDRLLPTPRDPRLQGLGIVLAGTTLRPHPSADLRFPINLAARAKPFAPDGHDEDESDPEAFARQMRREAYITTSQLKLRIALARRKAGREAIRLSEVLDLFPLKYGLLELNAFIELAVQHVPSSFDAQRVSVTRLVDEYEDPVGRRTCTCFDPVFEPRGAPGAGIEQIHCLLPEGGGSDTGSIEVLEEACLRDQIQRLVAQRPSSAGVATSVSPSQSIAPKV
jgi:hypothetical protein